MYRDNWHLLSDSLKENAIQQCRPVAGMFSDFETYLRVKAVLDKHTPLLDAHRFYAGLDFVLATHPQSDLHADLEGILQAYTLSPDGEQLRLDVESCLAKHQKVVWRQA